MRLKHIVFLSLFPVFLFAQNEYLDYRSVTNPLYWKNRKPFEGYWQQDVHYNINAELNDSTDIISASEELTYWNNSPYDLSFVYFHLYSNAQNKDSYTSDLYKNNGYKLKYGKYRDKNLGCEVTSMKVDGKELKVELDNTVLKVWLPKPVKSGESITFNINFKTYFDKEAILAFPFPFGIVGLHRIYLGTAPHVPVVYIGTFGGVLGILPFIDFCVIILDKDFDRYINNNKIFMWVK